MNPIHLCYQKLLSPKDHVIKKPLLIQLKNGQFVVVVAHYMKGKSPSSIVSFFDFTTGIKLKEFILPTDKLSENALFDLSELCPVDLNQRGYVGIWRLS